MKAVFCETYGSPEVLSVRDVPRPVPKPGEMLVKIHAAAVNSGDVRSRALDVNEPMKTLIRLMLGFKRPRNPILGTVFAGTVMEAVPPAAGFAPGEKVFGATEGFRFGCHAEYVTLKADGAVAFMPHNAGFDEAAALVFGGTTALFFLDKAGLKPGQRLLVYGASGAVGTMAVQIGKILGAHVTAAASAKNEGLVTGLGADAFVDYTATDAEKRYGRHDVVLDAVGKLRKGKALLKPGGAYLTVGGMTIARETREQLLRLKEWREKGLLRAVIDKTYPLEEAADAHRYAQTGRKRGSLVLNVSAGEGV